MDRHTLEVLDFPKVLELLAEGAQSPQGSDLCRGLILAPSLEAAERALDELESLSALEPLLGFPPTGGMQRIEEFLDIAKREGSCLDPDAFLRVRETVAACHRLLEYLEDAAAEGSILGAYAGEVVPLYELEDRFGRTFGPRGEILDEASPALAEIRGDLKRLRGRILRILEAVLGDRVAEPAVQDDFITQRGDRYVIPLKTDFRGYLKGIIHDRSRSGATFFVEPMEAVELNNQMSVLKEDEEKEVRRILLELTSWVGREAPRIRGNLAVGAHMDALGARLRLARRLRCVRPALLGEAVMDARQVRHPLLQAQEGVDVVPVDIALGAESRLLLITGANAGGKTVALKTAGLVALMSRAGLFIPAEEGSRVGWFRGLFADIGDEQDIHRHLSTFSAHMSHIRDILESAGEGSLVLLDELGTGTDPQEGCALAMAVLDGLLDAGARVVATTHLAGLKAFVYGRSDALNASVAFDPASGRPLFRLVYGQSGTSNALEAAERLGIPADILARARAYAGAGNDGPSALLDGIERARDQANRAAEEAEALRFEWGRRLEEQEALLAQARRERDSAKREATRAAEALLSELRSELRGVISGFARRELTQQEAEQALGKAEERAGEAFQPETPEPSDEIPERLAEGARVFVANLGKGGILEALEAGGQRATVRVGTLRVTVPAAELRRPRDGEPIQRSQDDRVGAVRVEAEREAPDVVVVGCSVDDALARVDWALDRALLRGVEGFRIVHGRGTGALRRAVRGHLTGAPHVRNVRPVEGDDAVTWVELA